MKNKKTAIKITLIIFGKDFDPDDFTSTINIQPTNKWEKGDEVKFLRKLKRKDRKPLFRNDSAWEYSTQIFDSLYFDEISKQILKVFNGKIEIIKNYIVNNNLEISVNAVIQIEDCEIPSIHIDLDLIKMCEKLGAEIDVDLYI